MLLLLLVSVACESARHDTRPAVQLPEDEGEHDTPLEWWYYTGHLTAEDHSAWGFEVTFFKMSSGASLYLGNFAITDHQTQRFFFVEQVGLDDEPKLNQDYALDVSGWQAVGADGYDAISVDAGKYALALETTPLKEAVLHGNDGQTGDGHDAAHYYSRTRLAAKGTLTKDAKTQLVQGTAWMDHQWFDNKVQLSHFKWDWLALQLDDSIEIMLGVLHADELSAAEGTWVTEAGAGMHMTGDDFSVVPTGEWTNPKSGHTYPMGWKVTIPARNVELVVEPVMQDQELYGLTYTPLDYWEGEVRVHGTRDMHPVQGEGYVELTGYAQ